MADRPTGISRPEAKKLLSTYQPPPSKPPPEPPPSQTQSVLIGKDLETGQEVRLGDIERRSGLYILRQAGDGQECAYGQYGHRRFISWA